MIVEKIEKDSGGGSVVLAFLLGGVMIAVAVVGFLMWDNYTSGGQHASAPINVTVKK